MPLSDLFKNIDTKKLKEQFDEVVDKAKEVANSDEVKNVFQNIKDAIPDEIEDVFKKKEAEDKNEEVIEEPVIQPQTTAKVSYSMSNYIGIDKDDYYEEIPEDFLPARDKILEVIAKDFPNIEVRENVSPTTIGGVGKFMNYSFGLYSNDEPKLFIMLIGKTTNRLRTYRWSKEQADKIGVQMINFIEHAPNRYWYISQRIGKYL